MDKDPAEKSAVFVVAPRDFRDEEYFVPKEVLTQAGIKSFTASIQKGLAIGADGGEAGVDVLVRELVPEEFDAVVFVGGAGALKYLDNLDSYRIAAQTREAGKVLGAICVASVILAKAGVLEGKRATVWSSLLDRSTIKILEEKGAEYLDKPVVVDGRLITANGPSAAKEFGERLAEKIKSLD